MPTLLPRDDDYQPIPALRLKAGGAQTLSLTTSASTRTAAAFDDATCIIGLYASTPIYVRTGDSSVSAGSSDHYYPAGLYSCFSLGDARQGRHTHLAARAVEGDGTLYISEME